MAHASVVLTDGIATKNAPVGFSWTTFFFSFFPAFIRGDWRYGLLFLVLNILTSGLSAIVVSFFYNKWYIKSMLSRGWKVNSIHLTDEMSIKNYLGYIELPVSSKYRAD